jgi:hypothetical protein
MPAASTSLRLIFIIAQFRTILLYESNDGKVLPVPRAMPAALRWPWRIAEQRNGDLREERISGRSSGSY